MIHMEEQEKLIWEFTESENQWVTIGQHNLDENGNLKGRALEFKESVDLPEGNYFFRQTPESQIGKGDSTGRVRIILDVDDDL